ncbi:MAG: hypothetical protein ACRDT8_08820 [Micromonosporaceae bacterium]
MTSLKAVGRAAVPVTPRWHAPDAEYILDGKFLLCLMCRRWMQPAPRVDGSRAYSCGPPCPRSDVDAAPLESRTELAAMVRAVTILRPDLTRVRDAGADLAACSRACQPEPALEEVRRWERCDLSDRRALVRAAWVRLEVDERGKVRSVWREVGS